MGTQFLTLSYSVKYQIERHNSGKHFFTNKSRQFYYAKERHRIIKEIYDFLQQIPFTHFFPERNEKLMAHSKILPDPLNCL